MAVSLPFTQAGVGVFEVAITGLMVAFGVDKSQAAAFAIVAHVMEALPYFVTGPLTAIVLRVSPRDVFFIYKREVDAEVEAVAGLAAECMRHRRTSSGCSVCSTRKRYCGGRPTPAVDHPTPERRLDAQPGLRTSSATG